MMMLQVTGQHERRLVGGQSGHCGLLRHQPGPRGGDDQGPSARSESAHRT